MREDIAKAAWEGSAIEIVPNNYLDCDMECVSYCFTDFFYRFENVESIESYCLYDECNCTIGEITYTEEVITSGYFLIINIL